MVKKMVFFGIMVLSLVFLGACSGDSPTEPETTAPTGSTPDAGLAVEAGSQVEGIAIDSVCHKYWFKVDVVSGTEYAFRTYDLTTDGSGNDTDTYMYLFNENAKAQLTDMDITDLETHATNINDDCSNLCGPDPNSTTLQSTIIWTPDYTGTAYICVTTFECSNGNSVLENTVNPGYSFEVFVTP